MPHVVIYACSCDLREYITESGVSIIMVERVYIEAPLRNLQLQHIET